MKRFTTEHWLLLAGALSGLATIFGTIGGWGDLTKPGVVAGVLMMLGTQIRASFVPTRDADGETRVDPKTLVSVALALVIACGALAGCGAKVAKLPTAPAIVAGADQDVHAGAATALGIVLSGATVLDDLSRMEATVRPSIPPAEDAKLRAAIVASAQAGKAAVAKIRAGVTSWADVKAAVDPFTASVNPILAIIRAAGPTWKDKLAAVGEVLASVAVLAVEVYSGGGAFACCQ